MEYVHRLIYFLIVFNSAASCSPRRTQLTVNMRKQASFVANIES